ncbi:hypothetical protein BU15DRAFT_45096 [Melanogaster broomeanus]|nr:hypothetical protein BU15DRAFT_45096 [Melanogaster broomeanus]
MCGTRQVAGSVVNGVAILVTIFRLMYRWYMSTFWWEDGWAALALVFDIGCFVAVLMQIPPQNHIVSNWLLAVSLTCIIWCARMSILYSILRIANPSPRLRRVAYYIAALFLTMGVALLAEKLVICEINRCRYKDFVAITQLVSEYSNFFRMRSRIIFLIGHIADIVSDALLIAAPVRFLRDVRLSQKRRILILSTFSASILITGVTILHSVLLLEVPTNYTVIIGLLKAALSLLVCNSLVLVTFVYRVCHVDLDPSLDEQSAVIQFTSVVEMPSKGSVPSKGSLHPQPPHVPHGGALPPQRTALGSDTGTIESHALTELGACNEADCK